MSDQSRRATAPEMEAAMRVVTKSRPAPTVDKALVAQLIGDARAGGVAIDGEGGLLAELTKLVVESALAGELTAHLGYDEHERADSEGSRNARNGTRSKTVLTQSRSGRG